MISRIASIDFGTNTFHLLIAELDGNENIHEIYRKRFFIYLNRDAERCIHDHAKAEAIIAVNAFKSLIHEYDVSDVRAVATEVFRDKSDGKSFLSELSTLLGHNIELISGMNEAELIYEGVKHSLEGFKQSYIVMDIGGGSTEFIWHKNDRGGKFKSLLIGISRICQLVNYQGSLLAEDIPGIEAFLDKEVDVLVEEQWADVDSLVINAGSAELLPGQLLSTPIGRNACRLSLKQFRSMYDQLIFSTLEDRSRVDWIPELRKHRFPVFLIKLNYIINRFNIGQLIYSPASLKEGLILQK